MPSEELLEKVSHLPTTPGVYLWRDQYNRIMPDGLFAFLSSGQRAGMPPRWRCACRGYGSDTGLRPCGRTRCAAPPPGKSLLYHRR